MVEGNRNISGRSQKEIDDDVDFFTNHPFNCTKITPELLEREEYKALQALAFSGTPDENAKNFVKYGYEALSKILCKEAKNERIIIESGVYCFDTAIDEKPEDPELNFDAYLGRAKFNMFLRNFGHVKEDCIEALKYKDTVSVHIILSRSRLMLEKYDESVKFAKVGLEKYPDSDKLKQILEEASVQQKKEGERMEEI